MGAAWRRGGFVSQLNSVTQNLTAWEETTRCSRMPVWSSARIFGRSPRETSSGFRACPNGPLKVYGWWDQTSKWTVALQVGCGCFPFDKQRSERMKASGLCEYHFCFLPFGCPNGSRSPAMTTLFGSTACTALATALTIPRYLVALTGPRNRLLFTSFQTWNTWAAGTPGVVPSKCFASAVANAPRSAAFGVPALTPCGFFA